MSCTCTSLAFYILCKYFICTRGLQFLQLSWLFTTFGSIYLPACHWLLCRFRFYTQNHQNVTHYCRWNYPAVNEAVKMRRESQVRILKSGFTFTLNTVISQCCIWVLVLEQYSYLERMWKYGMMEAPESLNPPLMIWWAQSLGRPSVCFSCYTQARSPLYLYLYFNYLMQAKCCWCTIWVKHSLLGGVELGGHCFMKHGE